MRDDSRSIEEIRTAELAEAASGPAATFLTLRDKLSHVLGVRTVDLVVERALAEVADAYPILSTIKVEDGTLQTDTVAEAFRSVPYEDALAALNALSAVMVLVLGRILGRRVAESIAQSLKRNDLLYPVRNS